MLFVDIRNGKSPFKPDRDHLHHILQRAGLSSRQTLVAISAASIVMSVIGLAGEYFKVADLIMFVGFMLMFITYNLVIRHMTK